jgi:hypothetical protein
MTVRKIEDIRLASADLCRVTQMVAGHEFICLLPVHDDGKKKDQWDSRGRPARWRRHLMVRRYPHGDH